MGHCGRPRSFCVSMGAIWRSQSIWRRYLRRPFGSTRSECGIGALPDSQSSEFERAADVASPRDCSALSFRAGRPVGPQSVMFVMQEGGKLGSYGLALGRHRLVEEMLLHLVRQVAPYASSTVRDRRRKLETSLADTIPCRNSALVDDVSPQRFRC